SICEPPSRVVDGLALDGALPAAALLHPSAPPRAIRCVLIVNETRQNEIAHRVRPAARAIDEVMKLNPPGRAADATICGRPLAAALVALPDLAHDCPRDVIGLCRLNRRLGTRLVGYTLSPGRITHDSAQPLS